MKRITTLALTLLLVFPAYAEDISTSGVIRLSEPVEVTDEHEIFGSRIAEMREAKPLSEIIANEDDYADEEVFVRARVAKVCQKKGCFFIAQDGAAVARVTFIDYSFFVPTDSGDKTVTIVGTFSKKTLSEDQAKHYAQDAGADPDRIRGPRSEYAIVATSVIIPKS